MAGKKELGVLNASNVRELSNQIALRNVRHQGHDYVELRVEGKRHIFFCILCFSPCYNEDTLFAHLNGNLHRERYTAAKVTLLLPNRWPFNDGVFFFHNSSDQDSQLVISNQNKDGFLLSDKNSNLNHCKNLSSSEDNKLGRASTSNGTNLNADSENNNLSIPGVVIRDEISVLEVNFSGFGEISARIYEGEGFFNWIRRIWCAWLGKEREEDLGDMVRDHDFAVITFPYTYDLGRSGIYDNFSTWPRSSAHTDTETSEGSRKRGKKEKACSSAHTVVETVGGRGKKRRKSFSDPEDISKSLSSRCGSSRDGSVVSSSSTSEKIHRREIRDQERAAAERMCDVCQRKMLPGKDMATLLNMKTGRLACSSRNVNGAFHVFHTSCLVHWILICEFEIWKNQSSNSETTRETLRESRSKCSETEIKDGKRERVPISSVFCPECQGTGINIEGDHQLQPPTVPVSQMFSLKLEISDKHRAWMKSPEILQNNSTGLCFPSQSEEMIKEKVLPLKLLHFYKADV
ncbi:uncharacterized protein LOC122083185 [Macadamia integrifolia]|uniref:uncharacterized protein LOC122083185 n=1 Tax=Macadamia integrifolia TaxID=60698 RepID=UPI001C4F7879|nr:uncharacterized protein LOC122083185 [Macadamia integrifolia]